MYCHKEKWRKFFISICPVGQKGGEDMKIVKLAKWATSVLVISGIVQFANHYGKEIAREGETLFAQEGSAPKKQPPSLKERTQLAFRKGADWLCSQQSKEGFWKAMGQPSIGYTAMASYSLLGYPTLQDPNLKEIYRFAGVKGANYILAKQNEDGSFSELDGSNKNYVSSLAIMVLVAIEKGTKGENQEEKKFKDKCLVAIKKAQDYLVGNQKKDGIYKGGMGYGEIKEGGKKQRDASDMSNTSFAAEALKVSGLPEDSEYWKNVVEFLSACQNNSETNGNPLVVAELDKKKLKVGDDGGFHYTPVESKAGEETFPDGTKVLKSYGSMTYSGLKSFLYAKVDKNDPRVQSAYRWIKENYTLDLNPGFGIDEVKRTHLQGLFYYYYVFAKGLDAYGEEIIETSDGGKHKWAEELAEKLIELQKAEGGAAWKNESQRWGEGEPVLATSYALISLNTVMKWIKK